MVKLACSSTQIVMTQERERPGTDGWTLVYDIKSNYNGLSSARRGFRLSGALEVCFWADKASEEESRGEV